MAATETGDNIMARARTIATQTMSDANQSVVIDSLGGIRTLLNNVIRDVYRKKAENQKFIRDIMTRNTVVVTTGVGACPDTIMRELLHQSEFQDDNDSLISYDDYNIDYSSTTNFSQLGYVVISGNNFLYTAPSPDLDTYTGNLFVTCPTFPTLPGSMASAITFVSVSTIDDIVLALSAAITGQLQYTTV